MTTTPLAPGADQAEGGRVWQPNSTAAQKTATSKTSRHSIHIQEGVKILILLISIFTFMIIMISAISNISQSKVVKVTEALSSELTINQQTPAQEQIKEWLPTTLGLEEAEIQNILLPTTADGSAGILVLTNDETIPFTLHNKNNQTFTVTKD